MLIGKWKSFKYTLIFKAPTNTAPCALYINMLEIRMFTPPYPICRNQDFYHTLTYMLKLGVLPHPILYVKIRIFTPP